MTTNFSIAASSSPLIRLLCGASALACATLATQPAHAILASYAEQVDQCVWSPVASMRVSLPGNAYAFCTAVHLRNGLFVTAAHCLDDAQAIRFRFGENANDPEMTVDLSAEQIAERCQMHPDGYPISSPLGGEGWHGPDIAYCKLPTHPGGLPESTPLTYGSCESDYFHNRLSKHTPLDAIGMGAHVENADSSSDFGIKRAVEVAPTGYSQRQGAQYLRVLQPDPCYGADIIRGGDSGSPLYLRMADGSYRVVGIAAAKNSEYNQAQCDGATRVVYYTPLARYLPWIESEAKRDLTRCHHWEQSSVAYEWDGYGTCVSQSYMTTPYETGDKRWDELACFDVDSNLTPHFSGECAGWDPCPLGTCLAAQSTSHSDEGGMSHAFGITTGGSQQASITDLRAPVLPTLMEEATLQAVRVRTRSLLIRR
jgi:hypothetical protein